MGNLQGFDATQIEPSEDFDVLPAGNYLALISSSEMKPTKAGDGQYLNLTFQIIEGQFQNRLLWHRLNLVNPNQTAVNIASAELAAICKAVGVLVPSDSSELHNIPMEIKVKVKRRNDTGEMQNEIKAFKKREQPAAQFGQPQTTTQGKPGNASAWKASMAQ